MNLHAHGPVPQGKRTPRVQLRPLRPTDVDLDYDAVMSSCEQLRTWSQTDWPADDFTREENLADLERHEREHREGVAFTFTVLNPEATRCLGCVYLGSPAPPITVLLDGAANAVNAGFWVRTSELAHDLDAHLLSALREWLASEWRFDDVVFTIARANARQETMLRAAGLEWLGSCTLPDGRVREVYRERKSERTG